jgi:hypothetical protein
MFRKTKVRPITDLEKNEIIIEWLQGKVDVFTRNELPDANPGTTLKILLEGELRMNKYLDPNHRFIK